MTHPRIAIAPNDDPRWEKARSGDIEARNSLVEEHIRLLDQVTAVVCSKLATYASREDIWSFGSFGLIRAVETYDPSIASFRTHAVFLIKARIYDELRSMDWLPKSARKKVRDVDAAFSDLALANSRPATDEEVAESMGVDVSYVVQARLAKASTVMTSLDDLIEEQQWSGEVNTHSDHLMVSDYLSMFSDWVGTLPEEEQAVWALRFYCRKTSKQVAEELGVRTVDVAQASSRIFQSFHQYVASIQMAH